MVAQLIEPLFIISTNHAQNVIPLVLYFFPQRSRNKHPPLVIIKTIIIMILHQ